MLCGQGSALGAIAIDIHPSFDESARVGTGPVGQTHGRDAMDEHRGPRLAVDIYQIADDQLFKKNRVDGAGWDWGWADFQRDWMDATPHRNAYRCLPLTIVNQTGWWIRNPVGFTATWDGSPAAGSIAFAFDSPDPAWPQWVNSQFGEGIITWNTPFLFRTRPSGSRLLITGPTNYFRQGVQPLTALIESDWMTMSFTMNYKVLAPREPVRFEAGEPLFQAIPVATNVCADLEGAEVRYRRLVDDPAMLQAYVDWSTGRTEFHKAKARREVAGDQWQKDYFRGRDATGAVAPTEHKTKLKPPTIHYDPPAADPRVDPAEASSRGPSRPSGRPRPLAPRRGPVRSPRHEAANPAAKVESLATCPMGFGARVALAEPLAVTAANPGRADEQDRPGDGQEVAMKRLAKPLKRITRPDSSVQTIRADARESRVEPSTQVTDDQRRWIAEHLLLDSPPDVIHRTMVAAGIESDEAVAEINRALASPYFLGAWRLRNRLRKRDWLLATYRKVNRLHPAATTIPRRHRLSRAEFLAEYYSTNRPVIITGMMDDWPALRRWNLDFFLQHFAGREVEVQFGREAGANYETEREKYLRKIDFGDFVRLVRDAGQTNDFYLTANNNSSNKQVLPELWADIVQVPEYLDGRDPMNGFFWMGPRGTVTPFHHDLTNNFMAQVVGRKLIKLAPSWDVPMMRNDHHVFSQIDGRGVPPQVSPPLDHPQVIECVLAPGEILFLPIGCWHYVEGLDVSVTVSFTNFIFDNDFSSFYSTYQQV